MTPQRTHRASEHGGVRRSAGQGPGGAEVSHQLRQDAARDLERVLGAARPGLGERGAGALREDVGYQDLVVLFWTITDLVEATRRTAPRIWERHLDLVLDGFRPGPSRPLPVAVSAAKWHAVVAERHERVR